MYISRARPWQGTAARRRNLLQHAGRSAHTLRAYRSELARLAAFHGGDEGELDVATLRAFLSTRAHLSVASRARTHTAISSFLGWAYRHDYIDADPMARIERVRIPAPAPQAWPRDRCRRSSPDPAHARATRLLFGLIASTGLRAGEALSLYVEDLDMTTDDEHLSVLGKGDRRRTLLLDDPQLVATLRRFLARTGYRHGPLFRAQKNGRGGPLSYRSTQRRWATYCATAGVTATLHQLRHTHATELVNDGVSLATLRKRPGHKNLQTTLRYAEQTARPSTPSYAAGAATRRTAAERRGERFQRRRPDSDQDLQPSTAEDHN